jgi:mandelate racemase
VSFESRDSGAGSSRVRRPHGPFNPDDRRCDGAGLVAPLKRPVRTAIGTVPAAPLVLIDVRTQEGVVGRSYLFGYTPVALAPLAKLVESLGDEIKSQPVAPVERYAAFDRRSPAARLQAAHGCV